MEHVRFILLRISALILLLGTFSCDDISREPRANPSRLVFDAQGGIQIVEITNLKKQWHFYKLFSSTNLDVEVNPEEITLKTLDNGVQQIHYDWVTFQYPKSKKYIIVIVAPNKTEKTRNVEFTAGGKGFANFIVIQRGITELE